MLRHKEALYILVNNSAVPITSRYYLQEYIMLLFKETLHNYLVSSAYSTLKC